MDVKLALDNVKSGEILTERHFYQLIVDFRIAYLHQSQFSERIAYHRNPGEVRMEILQELYSYLLQIQSREEMRDFDTQNHVLGYVPTKVVDIWKSDKRVKSLYNANKRYSELKGKDFNTIAIHIAEYRSMNKLVNRFQHSLNRTRTSVSIAKRIKSGARKDQQEPAELPLLQSKKVRKKIPQENKVRAELQKEISSQCPFCANVDVGHFEIHHIDENPSNNNNSNLFLLCPTCHSKITKKDIALAAVKLKKQELMQGNMTKDERITGRNIHFNSTVSSVVVGNSNTINISQSKKSEKSKYPPDCVGFDSAKANYISYLVDRYNQYKEYETGKSAMRYSVLLVQRYSAPVFLEVSTACGLLKSNFTLYPNPTYGSFQIDRSKDGEFIERVEVVDRSGNTVKVFNVPKKSTTFSVSLQGLSPAMYYVRIYNGKSWEVKPVSLK